MPQIMTSMSFTLIMHCHKQSESLKLLQKNIKLHFPASIFSKIFLGTCNRLLAGSLYQRFVNGLTHYTTAYVSRTLLILVPTIPPESVCVVLIVLI